MLLPMALYFFSSCKKSDDHAPIANKTYLKKYTEENSVYEYFYDQQNRLTQETYSEPGYTSYTIVTGYDASGNISSSKTRITGNAAVSIQNYSYDSQNRPLVTETRDSATNNLYRTTTYSYNGNKTTRAISYPGGTNGSRGEFTYDASGNMILEEWYNSAGTKTTSTSYSSFDDKISPRSLLPHFSRNGIVFKNNSTAYVYTNLVAGTTTNYTTNYSYNSDHYPTQAVINGGTAPFVINYTYEKR